MPNKKKKRTGCPMRNRRAPAKACPAGFCGKKEGRQIGVRNVPARAGRFEQSAALPGSNQRPFRARKLSRCTAGFCPQHIALFPGPPPLRCIAHRAQIGSGAVNSRPAPFCLCIRFCSASPRQFLRLLTHRVVGCFTKEKAHRLPDALFSGSPCWARTNDPAVNSRMLYRLS